MPTYSLLNILYICIPQKKKKRLNHKHMGIFEIIIVSFIVVLSLVLFFIMRTMTSKNKHNDDSLQTGVVLQLTSDKAKLEAEKVNLEKQVAELRSKQVESETEKNELRNAIGTLKIEHAQKTDSLKLQTDELLLRQERIESLTAENNKLTADFNALNVEKSKLETVNASLLETQQEVKKEIEQLQAQSKLQFEKIANEILDEKTSKFTETNRLNIKSILEPLDKSIDDFRRNINDNLSKETEQRTRVEEQIKKVMEQTTVVSEQANNLASALKTNNKTMGNWGENILETILENSGLMKGEHYATQKAYSDDDDKTKVPDVLVYMPDNRVVIIDSKVSLVDYERYFSVDLEEEKKVHLEKHIQSIKNHVVGLSGKKYDDITEALDFTMMFIPVESAYLLAMQADPQLWNFAYNKRILLVSATTLISSLKIISDLWRKDKQNKYAAQIVSESEKMYSKLVGFLETFEKIGKSLNTSKDSYDNAFNQLKSGRGNLIGRANKLVQLGVKADKQIPASFKDFDEETINHDV